MLDSVLFLGGEIAAAVELVRTWLMRVPVFSRLDEVTQSLVLQGLAFAVGAVAAIAQGVNVFPNAEPTLGAIMTGVVAGLPAQVIHVVLALIGIRAGSSAAVTVKAQGADTGYTTERYVPFL